MTDKILDKYTNRKPAELPGADLATEIEALDDLGAFGWLRGIRDRATMLELRRKDGNVRAIGYAWLHQIDFDPSEGITLHHAGQKIRIIGRNLNSEARSNVRMFQGITRARVPWIQEADGPTLVQSAESATIIEKIEW